MPGPTLLANELLEMCREDVDGVREETDEENDWLRLIRLVPFICEIERLRELVVPLGLGISPARSARVFRFGAGSGTTSFSVSNRLSSPRRYHSIQRTSRNLVFMADSIWWRHHVCDPSICGRSRHFIQALVG